MNAMHNEWKAAHAANLGGPSQHIHHADGDPAIRRMPEPAALCGALRYVDLDGYWRNTNCDVTQVRMQARRERYLRMRERGLGHTAAKVLAIAGHE